MRKPFSLIGSLAVIAPLTALGVTAAPSAGAQTVTRGQTAAGHAQGSTAGFRVIADHLSNPRGLAPAGQPRA